MIKLWLLISAVLACAEMQETEALIKQYEDKIEMLKKRIEAGGERQKHNVLLKEEDFAYLMSLVDQEVLRQP